MIVSIIEAQKETRVGINDFLKNRQTGAVLVVIQQYDNDIGLLSLSSGYVSIRFNSLSELNKELETHNRYEVYSRADYSANLHIARKTKEEN